jgi:hypothetical protein
MRPQVKWLLTAALAALATAPAFGQLIPGMFPALENGLQAPILLANRGVQKEIQMTEEQKNQFRKIVTDVHEKYKADLANARGDAKKWVSLIRESTQETTEKVNKSIPNILKPKQVKRLKQIEIQVNGLISLNKPEVQKQLKLTDKQREEIKGIDEGLKQDIAEVVKGASNGTRPRPLEAARKAAETPRKIQTLNDDATKKALAKLTSEQKKTWNEMTGEKFDFKFDVFNRPGTRP